MTPGSSSLSMSLRLTFASLLLAAAVSAPAQSPAPVELIDQLVANAEQYHANLPSLTADEAIDSEASFMGMFKSHAHATGTFRVLRAAPGVPLQESRQIAVLNGKPVEPGKHVTLPTTLFGGFGRFQEMFFTPEHRLCFSFTLLPQPGPRDTIQIAIASSGGAGQPPACTHDHATLTGLALVDPVAHQLVHVERTIPDEIAAPAKLAPFASVDLASTKVGDQTYWLPTTVTGTILNGKIRGRFLAHYSNYHRYTASITLLPGAVEVEPSPDPAPPASTPH
jgi:hypothetical protein